MPSSIPDIDTTSTILTGSSDGFVRAVKILPTKLLGVVADHGEWPVERIAVGGGTSQITLEEASGVDQSGGRVGKKTDEDQELEQAQTERSGRWWVGSVGHEEVLRLTDLEAFFHEGQMDKTNELDEPAGESGILGFIGDGEEDEDSDNASEGLEGPKEVNIPEAEEDSDADEDSDAPKLKKRKRKPEKDPLATKKKKGKNTVDAEPTFFDGL